MGKKGENQPFENKMVENKQTKPVEKIIKMKV